MMVILTRNNHSDGHLCHGCHLVAVASADKTLPKSPPKHSLSSPLRVEPFSTQNTILRTHLATAVRHRRQHLRSNPSKTKPDPSPRRFHDTPSPVTTMSATPLTPSSTGAQPPKTTTTVSYAPASGHRSVDKSCRCSGWSSGIATWHGDSAGHRVRNHDGILTSTILVA